MALHQRGIGNGTKMFVLLRFWNNEQVSMIRNNMRRLPSVQTFRKLTQRVLGFNLVQFAQKRFDGLISLSKVVMRDGREQMMHDMSSNVMMKVLQNAVNSVDGFEIASYIVPIFGVVPLGARFCVMEEGDDYEPSTEGEKRNEIVDEKVEKSVSNAACSEEGCHDGPARDGGEHHGAFFLGE